MLQLSSLSIKGPDRMSVSIHRLRTARRANEVLDHALNAAEQSVMISSAASKLEELFNVLQIDHRNNHNTRDTSQRVIKMFVSAPGHWPNRRPVDLRTPHDANLRPCMCWSAALC